MPKYTFHRVSSDGIPTTTSHYECEGDESALAHAMENSAHCSIEIWCGQEKVGFVDGGIMGFARVRLGTDIPDCDPEETGTAANG